MANHKSAIKRHRQSIKKRERNRLVRSSIRTLSKKIPQAGEAPIKDSTAKDTTAKDSTAKDSNANQLKASLIAAERAIAKAAAKGVIHRRTAARKISRLAKRANKVISAA